MGVIANLKVVFLCEVVGWMVEEGEEVVVVD